MILAVLFDFDGIIVDSEPLHWNAFNVVLEPLGRPISWTDYRQTYIGFDDRQVFRHILPTLDQKKWAELIAKKAAAFQNLLKSDGVVVLPGIMKLIQTTTKMTPVALCSGASRKDIIPILKTLKIRSAFDVIVAAEDTPVSKPNPMPYAEAWDQLIQNFHTLGNASAGLAIEDTPEGIASAKGAGLKVLAVTHSHEAKLLADADAVVDSLEGFTLNKLNKLLYPNTAHPLFH